MRAKLRSSDTVKTPDQIASDKGNNITSTTLNATNVGNRIRDDKTANTTSTGTFVSQQMQQYADQLKSNTGQQIQGTYNILYKVF